MFNNTSAPVQSTIDTINNACRSRGGKYASYSCKTVSWDDSSRSTNGMGGLSSLGPNITDTYLKARDGTPLFTVRPDNWNEKLGTVNSSEIALISSINRESSDVSLSPFTLRDVLKQMDKHGSYAGIPKSCDLSSDDLDTQCSIRFQTTFLPVKESVMNPFAGTVSGRETLEFATEAYNYQTHSDDDPKNLILLCTTQGVAVQADESKTARIYHHSVDKAAAAAAASSPGGCVIHRHWLEAERTSHAVGGSQIETEAERADAISRGKATACVIGPRQMGTRFNVLMTIQVPLKQRAAVPTGGFFGSAPGFSGGPVYKAFGGSGSAAFAFSAPPPEYALDASSLPAPSFAPTAPSFPSAPKQTRQGTSNAARVSVGAKHDVWSGLRGTARSPTRHPSEHVTITVVLYNIVVGGVPTEADVVAAIDDLEKLYDACRSASRSGVSYANDNPFTSSDPPPAVSNHNTFPTSSLPPTPSTTPSSQQSNLRYVPQDILAQIRSLPLTMETFTYVHEIGLNRLSASPSSSKLLLESFGLFQLANDIHVQIHGYSSNTSLYNLACVCSRLVSCLPNMQPPQGGGAGGAAAVADWLWIVSEEKCLNASISWLRMAASAGYMNHGHMLNDADLEEVRSKRNKAFQSAVQISQAMESFQG